MGNTIYLLHIVMRLSDRVCFHGGIEMSNKPLRIALICCLLYATGTVSAQANYSVEYINGAVDCRVGQDWKSLGPGDPVSADTSIRLSRGAIVELAASGKRISLVKEGVYAMASLSASSREPQKAQLLEIVSQKMRYLFKGSGGTESVFGVRAAQVETAGFESGGAVAKAQGEASLAAGDYAAAARSFEYALDEAMPDEEEPLRILLATTLALMDRPAAALGLLRGGDTTITPSRALLESSLLLRAGAPDEALALLRATSIKSGGNVAMAEAAEMEGLTLESLQRPAEAIEAYRRAVAAAAGSEAAIRSKERLVALGG